MGLVILTIAVGGCGQAGPRLTAVTGVVTLDGSPLPRAIFDFTPAEGGRGAYAVTDGKGCYMLQFLPGRPGATAGSHRVSISTADEAGRAESVPARYNRTSELTAEIGRSSAMINFELETP